MKQLIFFLSSLLLCASLRGETPTPSETDGQLAAVVIEEDIGPSYDNGRCYYGPDGTYYCDTYREEEDYYYPFPFFFFGGDYDYHYDHHDGHHDGHHDDGHHDGGHHGGGGHGGGGHHGGGGKH